MTVKEVISILPDAKCFQLAWDGISIPFDPKVLLQLSAYGDYIVSYVSAYWRESRDNVDPADHYEIGIVATPKKAGVSV